jgi:hypothetical protein
MHSDSDRSDRVDRSAGGRIAMGFVIGPAIGGILGLLAGLLFFDAGSRGMWASVIAGLIFGMLGGFWGGLSSLRPPAAEDEPLRRELDEGHFVEGDRPTD